MCTMYSVIYPSNALVTSKDFTKSDYDVQRSKVQMFNWLFNLTVRVNRPSVSETLDSTGWPRHKEKREFGSPFF